MAAMHPLLRQTTRLRFGGAVPQNSLWLGWASTPHLVLKPEGGGAGTDPFMRSHITNSCSMLFSVQIARMGVQLFEIGRP